VKTNFSAVKKLLKYRRLSHCIHYGLCGPSFAPLIFTNEANLKTKTVTSRTVLSLIIVSLFMPSIEALRAEPPPTAQQQQSREDSGSDRSGSSGAAAAAAAAGAAMAGLACIMGLKAAQEAPPGQKSMLQMMAMQQCSQAAQNAASAAQNGEQKKSLDTPQQQNQNQPFKVEELKEPKDGEKPDLSKLAQNSNITPSETGPTEKISPFEIPPQPETKKVETPQTQLPTGPVLPATSTPNLIDNATITAKKEDNNSNPTDEASRVLGNALAGRGSADDLLKKALAETNANNTPNQTPLITPKGSKRKTAGSEDEGGSGGGFSSGESKGSDPFDSLLAQMMGGGAQGAATDAFLGGAGIQVVTLPSDKSGKPKLNIFQFAATVYSELSHTANRVNMRPNRNARPSELSSSAVTNSVLKASIR